MLFTYTNSSTTRVAFFVLGGLINHLSTISEFVYLLLVFLS